MTQIHPNLPLVLGFTPGQDNWSEDMNVNLAKIGALVNGVVTAIDVVSPPSNPADYALYILSDAPTGTFSSYAKHLAFHSSSGWTFIAPREGWNAWVIPAGRRYTYRQARWIADDVATHFEGNWTTGTHYTTNSVVLQGGIAYLCIADHTSGSFNTDVATKKWAVYQGTVKRGAYSKRVTVIGSSVPAGVGASGNYGYMQRLATALAADPYNYTFANVSIGGNRTTDVINRFYADVLPTDPDIVIIALSLGNEGLQGASDKDALCRSYIANMLKLANMATQIGCKVLLMGAYPRNDYSATDYKYLKQTSQILENSKVPYLNLLGAIDDGNGHWRDGMWADALHPNDTGHESMFRAIPLSLLDNLLFDGEDLSPSFIDPRLIVKLGNQAVQFSNEYIPESPFGSVTAACTVRRPIGQTPGRAILIMRSTGLATTPLRIRNNVDAWAACIGDTNYLESSTLSSTGATAHICLRFDYHSNLISFFVDGVKVGVFSASIGDITSISFGSRFDEPGANAGNYEFGSFAVWRTALSDEQIFDAANGKFSKASLCLLSPPYDSEINATTRLVNLAPSSTSLRFYVDDVSVLPAPVLMKEVARIDSSIAALQALNASNFPSGTFTPALLASGVVYTRQDGWWSVTGDTFHFEIYLQVSSAPASTPIQIAMPQPALGRPMFMSTRHIGSALTAGRSAYAYMNYDAAEGASTLIVAQREVNGPPETLYADTGTDLKITGSYRFR